MNILFTTTAKKKKLYKKKSLFQINDNDYNGIISCNVAQLT